MSKILISVTASFIVATALGVLPVSAADSHDHDHKVTSLGSVAEGIKVLDGLIAEVLGKVGKNDFEGLHPTSDEVRATADALEARIGDVGDLNKERYKFNTDQLKGLAAQLEEAHESKNKDAAEKVAKRMESIRDRLKSLTPAG